MIASLADLNGSSTGFYRNYGYAPQKAPLLGVARGIRSDEWADHTPAILNQVLRPDRFEFERSAFGDHAISLAGNLPIWHLSTLFRPQFWSFFLLPVDYAFAVYWQLKGFVLIIGVFTWLLLATQSSLASATGALWYFSSSFTQWTYSWPSLLPEMVGLLCLTLVFMCYLTVGTNGVALLLTAAGAASCLINFVLCGYPPHLIPLCWFAIFFFAGWCFAYRKSIFRREALGRRLFATIGTLALVAVIGAIVYADLRQAIAVEANTVYPGRRRLAGGVGLSLPVLLSHFMQWSETETRFPSVTPNICEAAGFLWFAPITWLFWRRRLVPLAKHVTFLILSMFFLFIGFWMIAPVPEQIGKLFGLNLTFGQRCLPALGLANIAIVALFLSNRRERTVESSDFAWSTWILRSISAFVLFSGVLLAANAGIRWFFSWREVLISACLGTFLILLLYGSRRGFATALIVLQLAMFGTVNPLERGLGVITSSELAAFVQNHPELRKDRWLVYSDALAASGFLTALGCDAYTKMRYLPDVDHFALFAARGLDTEVINRGGYLTAHLTGPSQPSRFELISANVIRWHVDVSDPLLKELGIRYLAFDRKPPPEATAHLMPLSAKPVGNLWLYRVL